MGYRLIISMFLIFGFANANAQECDIWYVTTGGTGVGTVTDPASLQTALNGVVPGVDHIRMGVGPYLFDQQLDLVGGVVLEGGYNPTTWEKSNNGVSLIYRSNANITPGPERLVAISAVGISDFRLQDLDVEVQDAVGIGVTTYGIYLSGCSDYSIVRCKVEAGSGANGVNGIPGVNGQNGVDGTDGQGGNQCGGGNTAGGTGGSSWSAGVATGGNGGNGGAEGSGWSCCVWGIPPWTVGQGNNGQVGQPGAGGNNGTGGIAGLGYQQTLPACWVIFGIEVPQNCQAGGPNFGQPGVDALADGADGVNGANGVPSHVGGFFMPGNGVDGIDGEDGSGGGGGGGGGSFGELIALMGTGSGPGGAGGGEGGEGGTGATGGSGGGGSFGIYVDNNGTGGVIGDCNVNSSIPGYGGIGGFPGGYGGFYGVGAQGGTGCGTGGDGGDGSDGGDGGAGGNGAAGEAQPIYQNPFGIPVTQYSLNANVEPEVRLKSTGCTYSDIEFSTNAFGIIEWFYEGGTNPLNDIGTDVTNQYFNQGAHDVTMVSNGVPYQLSDFVHIFKDGTPFLPTIQGTDTICPGVTVNFSATWPTAFSVLDYEWEFGDPTSGTNTSSSANPSHTYADVGTYLVQLQTESPCCGWSKIDSFYVEVIPNVNPEVFITVTATEICEGETVSFGAVPYFGGPTPAYEWFHNNASSGNGPSYTPVSIIDGDEVYVQMTSSYPCPPNAQVNSEIVVMTVHPLPVIDCSNLANTYLGAETQFDAQVSVGTAPFQFEWQLGDGAFSTDSTPSYEYGSTGTYNASVEVTDANGCSDICDVQVDIILPPFVEADFTYVIDQQCGVTNVQFTDVSTGNPIQWEWDFGNGQYSPLQSPVVSFTAPGPYTVTLVANNGIFWDTIVMPNLVEVWEIPTASFYPDVSEQCDSIELRFFDESTDAVEWSWNFGDPGTVGSNSSNLQNPYHQYNDPGLFPVTLTVTSDDGCISDVASITVEIFKSPISEFEVPDSVCATDEVIFQDLSVDDVDIDNWTYRFGKESDEEDFMNQDLYIHIFDEPGAYEVTQFVRNNNGCVDSSMQVVEVIPYPIASFYADADELFLPDSVMYFHNISEHAEDDLSDWDFGNGTGVEDFRDPYGIYPDSGLFQITLFVENELGCLDDTTQDLRVWEQETFYIASAFTPNEDGVNDIFDIQEKGIIEWHMVIYDRWGKVVFESRDVKESWNGRHMISGKELPQGGYAYSIQLKWYTGREFERMGTITLYR